MRKFLFLLAALFLGACHKKDNLSNEDYSQWYSEKEGLAVIQGDIVLGQLAEVAAKYGGAAASSFKGVRKGVGPVDESAFHLWPGGVVPYVLAADFPKPERILTAMYEIEYNSAIRFVPRTDQADYLTFVKAPGWCASYLGKIGGAQSVYVADLCTRGNMLHELGHAIGLFHEQSRSDRDSYVKILWENVTKGTEINFMKDADFGIPLFKLRKDIGNYDLGSVMQSDAFAYSSNGLPTIATVDGSPFGQRKLLSAGDINAIRYLYGAQGQLAGHTGPGAPDRDFGDLGEMNLGFGRAWATDGNLARQSDGKILIAGSNVQAPSGFSAPNPANTAPFQAQIARVTPAGVLDTSFGTGGKTLIGLSSFTEAYAVEVLADGKILVAGGTHTVYFSPGDTATAFITRLLANGTIDTTFGVNGTAKVNYGNGIFNRLRVLTDGKIIAMMGGYALCRFSSAGVLDTSFAGSGCGSPQSATGDSSQEYEVLPDGTVYAVVGGNYAATQQVARLLPNLTLDTTYGTGGKSQTVAQPAGLDWSGAHLAVYPDGKVVVTNRITTANAQVITADGDGFELHRFLADGTLDPQFGTNGVFKVQGQELGRSVGPIYSLHPLANGKLLLAGWGGTYVRNNDGSPDPSYNPTYPGGDGVTVGNGKITVLQIGFGSGELFQMALP